MLWPRMRAIAQRTKAVRLAWTCPCTQSSKVSGSSTVTPSVWPAAPSVCPGSPAGCGAGSGVLRVCNAISRRCHVSEGGSLHHARTHLAVGAPGAIAAAASCAPSSSAKQQQRIIYAMPAAGSRGAVGSAGAGSGGVNYGSYDDAVWLCTAGWWDLPHKARRVSIGASLTARRRRISTAVGTLVGRPTTATGASLSSVLCCVTDIAYLISHPPRLETLAPTDNRYIRRGREVSQNYCC